MKKMIVFLIFIIFNYNILLAEELKEPKFDFNTKRPLKVFVSYDALKGISYDIIYLTTLFDDRFELKFEYYSNASRMLYDFDLHYNRSFEMSNADFPRFDLGFRKYFKGAYFFHIGATAGYGTYNPRYNDTHSDYLTLFGDPTFQEGSNPEELYELGEYTSADIELISQIFSTGLVFGISETYSFGLSWNIEFGLAYNIILNQEIITYPYFESLDLYEKIKFKNDDLDNPTLEDFIQFHFKIGFGYAIKLGSFYDF